VPAPDAAGEVLVCTEELGVAVVAGGPGLAEGGDAAGLLTGAAAADDAGQHRSHGRGDARAQHLRVVGVVACDRLAVGPVDLADRHRTEVVRVVRVVAGDGVEIAADPLAAV